MMPPENFRAVSDVKDEKAKETKVKDGWKLYASPVFIEYLQNIERSLRFHII